MKLVFSQDIKVQQKNNSKQKGKKNDSHVKLTFSWDIKIQQQKEKKVDANMK